MGDDARQSFQPFEQTRVGHVSIAEHQRVAVLGRLRPPVGLQRDAQALRLTRPHEGGAEAPRPETDVQVESGVGAANPDLPREMAIEEAHDGPESGPVASLRRQDVPFQVPLLDESSQ